ncbi:hypothetical protein CC79DRAFT_981771 [Sarocladium strictum]
MLCLSEACKSRLYQCWATERGRGEGVLDLQRRAPPHTGCLISAVEVEALTISLTTFCPYQLLGDEMRPAGHVQYIVDRPSCSNLRRLSASNCPRHCSLSSANAFVLAKVNVSNPGAIFASQLSEKMDNSSSLGGRHFSCGLVEYVSNSTLFAVCESPNKAVKTTNNHHVVNVASWKTVVATRESAEGAIARIRHHNANALLGIRTGFDKKTA